MKPLLLFSALFVSLLHADDKATVVLDANGYSSSGGSDRPVMAEVEVKKGFGKKKEIPISEQIAALKSHIAYLTLMEKHGIDLAKPITATFTEVPLVDALKELLPKVPVKFEGADAAVTIKSLKAEKARLAAVIDFLDKAAGVYFVFTDEGIIVKAEPPVAK